MQTSIQGTQQRGGIEMNSSPTTGPALVDMQYDRTPTSASSSTGSSMHDAASLLSTVHSGASSWPESEHEDANQNVDWDEGMDLIGTQRSAATIPGKPLRQ